MTLAGYRHFLAAGASLSTRAERDVARRDGFVGRIGLSAADHAIYVEALTGLSDELVALDVRMRAAHDDAGALESLRTEHRRVLDLAVLGVKAALSPDGAQRLDSYVKGHVKARIRVYSSSAQ